LRLLSAAALRRLGVVLTLIGVVGCDIPTQLPLYDTTWEVVAVRDSIATADLLPQHLRAAGGRFAIDSFAVEGEVRLGEVCEVCTCFQGPIPPMTLAPHDWPLKLPPGVISARLERGRAHVVIQNQVGFDVMDDGNGGKGFLVVDLVDIRDDQSHGQVLLMEPFPPGDSLEISFDLAGLELNQYLVARVHGYMPGSACAVNLTPESGFRVKVVLEQVIAGTVEVWVSDLALRLQERSLALPSFVASRLRAGEADLTVEVEVETRLPADVEIGMSAAGRREDLFSERAALYTPLLIPEGQPATPRAIKKRYVVQLASLDHAGNLFLDTRNRFTTFRPMTLRGGEAVSYQVRLRAQVPSR
jgi:hypothetical protein